MSDEKQVTGSYLPFTIITLICIAIPCVAFYWIKIQAGGELPDDYMKWGESTSL